MSRLPVILLAAGAASALDPRIGVMLAILGVSLFAVSFPTISKQIPFLRIPGILFFIGKHFGTGVILATAFIHLLDDAFRSLQNPIVEARYGRVGKWTGGIILAALLAIFLVEYTSTTYVEHLQNRPSAPPTPIASPLDTPSSSRSRTSSSVSSLSPANPRSNPKPTPPPPRISENTHLLAPPVTTSVSQTSQTVEVPVIAPPVLHTRSLTLPPTNHNLTGYQSITLPRTHPPHHHAPIPHHHHSGLPQLAVGIPIEVLTNSPRVCRLGLGGIAADKKHDVEHIEHVKHDLLQYARREAGEEDVLLEGGSRERDGASRHQHDHHHQGEVPTSQRVGRKRQVIGILVLQLGIMIHSLVIGLTLAVTKGSDFTSLTTAIIFHQLFEGLSLGIRIAALPPPPCTRAHSHGRLRHHKHRHHHEHGHGHEGHDHEGHDHGHSGLSRVFRQVRSSASNVHWLKPSLSFLFAVTTPLGMLLGMHFLSGPLPSSSFSPYTTTSSSSSYPPIDPILGPTTLIPNAHEQARMLLIQGVMSAVSAGLLIYASTVEMIAGDFVFGDVEGKGHHHHHHVDERPDSHSHSHAHGHGHSQTSGEEAQEGTERVRVRVRVGTTDSEGQSEDDPEDRQAHASASLGKKALAVVSLLAGAGGMVLVGLGE